jgi:hypothetical protein
MLFTLMINGLDQPPYFAEMIGHSVPSYCLMSTYDLPYAKEHLFELFNDARAGEEVIIVRADGRSCELTPLAEVKQEETIATAATIPDEAPGAGEMVPV